jgi:hypothetical protein
MLFVMWPRSVHLFDVEFAVGVTFSLHLIDPSKFARVLEELQPRQLSSVREVELYLDRHEVTQDDDRQWIVDLFKDAFEDPAEEWIAAAYSQLLLDVVTDTYWDLHKSLNNRGLTKPIKTFPALKPVRFLVTFDGWYTHPPVEISCDSGLYGLWSAAFLRPALKTMDQFPTRESAQDYAPTVKWSFLDRVSGRQARTDDALEAWIDYWECWEAIGQAFKETVARDWSLGFAMCP